MMTIQSVMIKVKKAQAVEEKSHIQTIYLSEQSWLGVGKGRGKKSCSLHTQATTKSFELHTFQSLIRRDFCRGATLLYQKDKELISKSLLLKSALFLRSKVLIKTSSSSVLVLVISLTATYLNLGILKIKPWTSLFQRNSKNLIIGHTLILIWG